MIQNTLTHFGIRWVARENEPFVLKVSMPNGGPSGFSSLHVTCMATVWGRREANSELKFPTNPDLQKCVSATLLARL